MDQLVEDVEQGEIGKEIGDEVELGHDCSGDKQGAVEKETKGRDDIEERETGNQSVSYTFISMDLT